MAIYNLIFDYEDNDNIVGYNVSSKDLNDTIIYKKQFDNSIMTIKSYAKNYLYNNSNTIVVNDKIYENDCYPVSIYVNNSKLTNDNYKINIDDKNSYLCLNPNLNINNGTEITIEYYKMICSIEVEINYEYATFSVSNIYKKDHTIGNHTIVS